MSGYEIVSGGEGVVRAGISAGLRSRGVTRWYIAKGCKTWSIGWPGTIPITLS